MMCRLCIKEWLPAIAANKKNFQVNKGEILFGEGTAMTGIYFVFTGMFKVHKRWGDEKELIVRFAKAGDIIGHRGLGKDTIFPVSATAMEPSVVCFVELDFFLSTLKVNDDLLFQLMMFYASELKESEKHMRNLAHMSVKGRIAVALLTLQEKFGKDDANFINIVMSRQDLSSFVGTSYETLFRLMNEYTSEGIIQVEDKKIRIENEEKLLSYSRETS
jgi:CRP-like cAMP-binding protein